MKDPDFGWSYPAGCSETPFDDGGYEYCMACGKPDSQWDDSWNEDDCVMKKEREDLVFCSSKCRESYNDYYSMKSHEDLATKLLQCAPDESSMSCAVYKATICGAFLTFAEKSYRRGVSLGSIVEGVDFGTRVYTLWYPFRHTDFWDVLNSIEKEAKEIWNSTHGCEQCENDGWEDPETGWIRINPNCPRCGGQGGII